MAKYKLKGIILKRTNFGEADRLLTIFTDKLGKVRAVGKGIRKQNSRLGGHLEPFCMGNLVIAEGRNLDIICEAEIIECFFDIRNNLKSTHISYYLTEAVDKLTEEGEKHQEIFDLLLDILENVGGPISEDLLLSCFELRLLALLGFRPELEQCLKCHRKLSPAGNFFDNSQGGLVCQRCQNNGVKISNNTIKVLRIFLKNQLATLKKLKTTPEIQKETRKITQNYLDYISGQEFKSRRFLSVGS